MLMPVVTYIHVCTRGAYDEYYSFIHAWFIHKFPRENILVIHSSCAWIIHLFTLGSDGLFTAHCQLCRTKATANANVFAQCTPTSIISPVSNRLVGWREEGR